MWTQSDAFSDRFQGDIACKIFIDHFFRSSDDITDRPARAPDIWIAKSRILSCVTWRNSSSSDA